VKTPGAPAEKERNQKEITRRLEEARRSVERCDAIRRGHLYPEVALEKRRNRGMIPKRSIRYVREDLQDARVEMRASMKLKMAVRASNILQIVTIPYFTILIVASVARISLQKPWDSIYSLPLMLPMFGLASAFLFIRQYVNRKLSKYVDKRASEESRDKNLKQLTQHCIAELAGEITKFGQDPHKFRFKIYHEDYDGIEIVSRPGLLRGHYVATVVGSKQGEK
jgi:hypothetical protein